ncbi:helix-hairpin-helix domain-containing protein [Pedobacter deserti]|uniref:helix-hairpin-helix domain-containing protein n=1 Tax=Pedobacter deserti TaxID=2817382 RepID=UPI00210C86C2|nr:helix-hairpin-helix domain-containing protein [Pedobacter sp. SYSU D00382]
MSTVRLFLCVFLLPGALGLTALRAGAQETDVIKDIIEQLSETLPEDTDWSELTERLIYLRKHPLDLNRADAGQLKELLFLSPLQIANLLNHIKANGELQDFVEMQVVEGFDELTLSRLSPFVYVGSAGSGFSGTGVAIEGKHDLMLRYGRLLEQQKGFKDLSGSRYLGGPDKVLMRYKYTVDKRFSVALIAEKDAGESWLNKYSPDHLSFHVALYNRGRLKRMVLGDYSLQFGQGLTLWSGFAYGKGPDVTSVAANETGLKPYYSANELSFFRGSAASIRLTQHLDLTAFVSRRRLDASLKQAEDGFTLQNIGSTGLHRTTTERKNQHSLSHTLYGTALQYHRSDLSVGLVAHHSGFGHRFVTGNQLYNKYSFEGRELSNAGFHYSYTWKNTYIYGEAANSIGSGWAFVNGMLSSLSPRLSWVILYRRYDRDYHNFFSRAPGEGTETSNERGFYTGFNYSIRKKWLFSVYGDYFRFPWLKYRVDAPSSGYETLGQATYTPNKQSRFLLRYKVERKQQNADGGGEGVVPVVKQTLRLDGSWKWGPRIALHHRTELSGYEKAAIKETGWAVMQDADYKPLRGWMSFNVRLAFFCTPSYNSRIYAYEDDVLYGAGSAAYSGKGLRFYQNVRLRLWGSGDLWLRYAIYRYSDRETVGTGLDEIQGRQKSDFKLQLRYQF